MYKKITIGVLLIAFASVQMANSLECWFCNGAADCEGATTTNVCNATSAQQTSTILGTFFTNTPVVQATTFQCINIQYVNETSGLTTMHVAGCQHDYDVCTLTPNAANANYNRTICDRCTEDLCNDPRSPAGTFSSSTLTIAGSALLLMIAKFFA